MTFLRNLYKSSSLLTLLFFISSAANAQSGLPIINMVDDGVGNTEYSLTLQLLANDSIDATPISSTYDDVFCENYNSYVFAQAGPWNCSNPTKSSFDWPIIVFNYFHNGTNY